MAQNYRRTLTKHSKAKNRPGEDYLHLGKFETHWPTFFQSCISLIKMSFTQLENHSQLLCGRNFANERLLLY